jgi:hypothetical protein
LFEKADGHIAYGAAIPRGFGFHFPVEVGSNLKSRFHKTGLLYCRMKNQGEGWRQVPCPIPSPP